MAFRDLPFGEQLMLWGVRLWVQALRDEGNVHDLLCRGFRLAGAPGAHPALDDLLTIIATTARGNVDIRCPRCRDISVDEHRLMGAVAAWQYQAGAVVADTFLDAWLPPAGLRMARAPASDLAAALRGAGLMIRPRRWVHHAPVHDGPPADPADPPATLH